MACDSNEMPVTGPPIQTKDDEEFKALSAQFKKCKTAEEIGTTAGRFVSG
jgi:hypothetical protein